MNSFNKLRAMKTLLVDDDELIRDALSLAFKKKDCFIKTTETAEDGLQALEQESFDIIISDFKLPGMNGLEFFKLATVSQSDTLKILITGYGDGEIASEAFGIGVQDFIEKPFSVKALIASLNRLIQNGDGKKNHAELK